MKKTPALTQLCRRTQVAIVTTLIGWGGYAPWASAQIQPAADGTGTQVSQTGNQIDIAGGSLSGDRQNLFHSFDEFGLTPEQIANFQVTGDIDNVLGRVVGGHPSIINGLLQVTGGGANLYLMNPAGIIFGPQAQLNIPGDFTATTATGIGFEGGWFSAVGDNSYSTLAGSPNQFAFMVADGATPGSIINDGNLALEPSQRLTLLGGSVINTGTLTAPGGQITVAAVPNDHLVRISQENMVLSLELEAIAPDSPNSPSSSPNPLPFSPLDVPALLTQPEVGNATAIEIAEDGAIRITGSTLDIPVAPGTAIATNTLTTTTDATLASDGMPAITLLGDDIALVDATVTASSPNAGGTVLIGGNESAQGSLPNAENVWVDGDSRIEANALVAGDGGTVVIWGDRSTQFFGDIEAQGGPQSGNGGFVGISGQAFLSFDGTVDTTAPAGTMGTLRLDTHDLRVVPSPSGDTDGDEVSNSEQLNRAGEDTVIAADTLETASSNIILQADNDIIMEADLDTTANPATPSLILQAGRSIDLNGSIQLRDGDFQAVINDAGADAAQRETGIPEFSLAPEQTLSVVSDGNITIGHGNFGGMDVGEVNLSGVVSADNGNITVVGTAADGLFWGGDRMGIQLNDAQLSTETGDINLTGTGGGFIDTDVNPEDVTDSGLGEFDEWIDLLDGIEGALTDSDAGASQGVFIDATSSVTTRVAGDVAITGVGGTTTSFIATNDGVQLDGLIEVNQGRLTLTGTRGDSVGDGYVWSVGSSGIWLSPGSEIRLNNSVGMLAGTIGAGADLFGSAGIGGDGVAIALNQSDITFLGQQAQEDSPNPITSSGGINAGLSLTDSTIVGTGETRVSLEGLLAAEYGIGLSLVEVEINAGQVDIGGLALSESGFSPGVMIGTSQITSDSGGLAIRGSSNNTAGVTLFDAELISTQPDETMTLTANDMDWWGMTTLQGVGTLHLQPLDPGSDITLIALDDHETTQLSDGRELQLDSGELAMITDGFGSIQIGREDGQGQLTTTGDLRFLDPLLLQMPGATGTIDTSASELSIGDANGAGTVQLVAGDRMMVGDLNVNASVVQLSHWNHDELPTVAGPGGMINLTAGTQMTVTGVLDAGSNGVEGSGNGGTVTLNAGQQIVLLNDIDVASTAADEVGQGGQITIESGGDLQATGRWDASANSGSGQSGAGGEIEAIATHDFTFTGSWDVSTATTRPAGQVSLTSTDGALNLTIPAEESAALRQNGSVQLNSATSTTVEMTADSANALFSTTGSALEMTSQGDVQVVANQPMTVATTGGSLTIQGTNLVLDSVNVSTAVVNGTGGDLTLVATESAIATGHLESSGQTGGEIQVLATTAITTGTIDASGSQYDGGNVTLDPSGDIQVGYINAEGGDQGSGGSVDITTASLFRATDTFTSRDQRSASISTIGGIEGGAITIRYGSGSETPFTIGDTALPSDHGTSGEITTGTAVLTTGESFVESFTRGNIRLINAAQPSLPTPGSPTDPPAPDPPVTPPADVIPPAIPDPPATPPTDAPIPATPNTATPPPTDVPIPATPNTATPPPTNVLTPTTSETVPTDSPTLDTFAPSTTDPLAPTTSPVPPPLIPTAAPTLSEGSTAIAQPPIVNSPTNGRSPNSGNPLTRDRGLGSRIPIEGDREGDRPPDGLEPRPPDRESEDGHFAPAINPNLTAPENQPDIRLDPIHDLEAKITRDYSQHFAHEFGVPPIGVLEAQTQLQQVQTATGTQPALIYALFVPTLASSPAIAPPVVDPADPLSTMLANAGPQGTDELELMLITTEGDPIRVRLPGITRSRVDRTVRQFQSDITSPAYRDSDRYLGSARTLYQWLVQPLEPHLTAAGLENLSFILDSGLRSLPIAALHDGDQFLIERYSVGIMPSLSLTDTRYVDSRNLGILAMGASEFDQQAPLPAVPLELATITEDVWENGAYFLNDQFTMENLKAQRHQRPYGIIHLATHGEFQSGAPENSYLQLGDRQLRLSELRELDLHDPAVELLVLSACRTALGDDEAELGFAGLALQAGVKSVMASLWYVSDAGALGLTTEFYRQLRQTPIKAEALRQAQLAMIRGEVAVEGDVLRNSRGVALPLPASSTRGGSTSADNTLDLSHPFYWSAFTMIGSPW
ncbi:MAG: CHAT domain-containing protein [Leptolyngbyaceae cyanobacterium]